jgi:GTPase Era involved in 16S rRNA processing
MDGTMLPCVLIENKIDLVNDEKIRNDSELKEFSLNHRFAGCFRTSAKTGTNINESMEFLIKTIVEKLELMSEDKSYEENVKKSIILQSKHSTKDRMNVKHNNCC